MNIFPSLLKGSFNIRKLVCRDCRWHDALRTLGNLEKVQVKCLCKKKIYTYISTFRLFCILYIRCCFVVFARQLCNNTTLQTWCFVNHLNEIVLQSLQINDNRVSDPLLKGFNISKQSLKSCYLLKAVKVFTVSKLQVRRNPNSYFLSYPYPAQSL